MYSHLRPQDRLLIHCDPEQNKAVSENEWNSYNITILLIWNTCRADCCPPGPPHPIVLSHPQWRDFLRTSLKAGQSAAWWPQVQSYSCFWGGHVTSLQLWWRWSSSDKPSSAADASLQASQPGTAWSLHSTVLKGGEKKNFFFLDLQVTKVRWVEFDDEDLAWSFLAHKNPKQLHIKQRHIFKW